MELYPSGPGAVGSFSGWVHAALQVCMHTLRCPWVHKSKAKCGRPVLQGTGGVCRLCCEPPQPPPPQGCTLQCQGAAGGTRWAGRRRKEHSFPCADGPRRAPAAPGPAPALSPLPFLGAILAGGGPVLGQVERWLWPWARPSISREQLSFSKLEGWLRFTAVGLGTRVLSCCHHRHHHGDLQEPVCLLWLGKPVGGPGQSTARPVALPAPLCTGPLAQSARLTRPAVWK